jgi:aminopeptidase
MLMTDTRIDRLARLLVEYSTKIGRGDRVLIEAEPPAEPLVRALFEYILKAGGHPQLLMSLSGLASSGLEDIFMTYANDEQLDFVPPFYKLAYDTFESRIRIWSESNTKSLTNIDRTRLSRRSKTMEPILQAQLTRGDKGEFRWMTTMFPTDAYAQDAEMSLSEFEDLFFRACHVDDPVHEPITYWKSVEVDQQKVIDALRGHEHVILRGPNCDLALSIKDRVFINSCGQRNMPDGEIYTGPVEGSTDGWIRFTYPAVHGGNEVEGIELKFSEGCVVEAKAEKNQTLLEQMIETDSGARYLGEFAIGTNFNVQQLTRNILFDEKIGGTIHVALGAGYPKTGSVNKSAIHWDMITDMSEGGEIIVDGTIIYKDGDFCL